MVGFRNLVGTYFAPVSNKTAVKGFFKNISRLASFALQKRFLAPF